MEMHNEIDGRKAELVGTVVAAAHHCAEAEAELREAVASARYESVSWNDVGAALGISAQAAQERFRRAGRSGMEVRMMVAGVPKSPKASSNLDQSNFKMALSVRLERGEAKKEAVDNAVADVRRTNPTFDPILPAGFLG